MLFGNVHQHQSRDVQLVARRDLRAGGNRVAGIETGKPRKAKVGSSKSQHKPRSAVRRSQQKPRSDARKSQEKPRKANQSQGFSQQRLGRRPAAKALWANVPPMPSKCPRMSTNVYVCLRGRGEGPSTSISPC